MSTIPMCDAMVLEKDVAKGVDLFDLGEPMWPEKSFLDVLLRTEVV